MESPLLMKPYGWQRPQGSYAFAAHLRIPDDELIELMGQGYDVVAISAIMQTNVNLMLIIE